jgi:proteasome lid subunit RPN8/RPN11
MTLNDAFEGHSLKTTHLMQRGSLLALAVAATLILAFGRRNGFMVGVVLALSTVVAPAVFVLGKRLILKVRQRETEARLVMQTKDYLQNHESECVVRDPGAKAPEMESDIEILARVIDGRKLPTEDFRRCQVTVSIPQEAEPVVFDALPRRYAVRSLYERRFADLAANLPKAVCMPLGELQPPATTQEFGYWAAGPRNLEIEYSNAALDEIRMRAAEGHQRMRHGGVEVGGVLFGTHDEGTVRILAMRPIECGYANGPRFILSDQDETALANLLESCAGDPDLAGLEPVGWYHSHTREEIHLSLADVRLFDRFFPQAWQVALVVRPANLTPTRAGFFFREADGKLRTASSYCEFHLGLMVSAAAA